MKHGYAQEEAWLRSGRSMATLRMKHAYLAAQRLRREALHLWCDDVTVVQVVEAAGRNHLALIDAPYDFDRAIALQTQLHRGAVDQTVVVDRDDQRTGIRTAVQDRLLRDEEGVLLLRGDDVESREHA